MTSNWEAQSIYLRAGLPCLGRTKDQADRNLMKFSRTTVLRKGRKSPCAVQAATAWEGAALLKKPSRTF